MPADSSIYARMQAPDIMGSIQRGLSMRDMLDEKTRQANIREAYASNMVTNEDGSTTMNRQGLLSDLAKNDPQQMMAMQDRFSRQDAAAAAAKQKERSYQIDMISRVAPQIKDQNTYEQAMQVLSENGVDVSKMPPVYDKGLVDRYSSLAMTAKEQLAQQNQDRNFGLQKDQFAFSKQRHSDQMGFNREKLNADKKAKAQEAKNAILGETRKFGKEWKSHDVTKKTAEVASAYERVKKMVENPSPAGDLSLVFNYMKMLDPGSVVRESEFRSAEQARGALSRFEEQGIPVPAFLKQSVQKLNGDGFLLPEQRADFAGQANNLFKAQMAQQQRVNDMFAGEAKNYGMDPGLVVNDRLFNVEMSQGAPGGGPQNQPAQYSADVISYAEKYGIDPAQANAIKQQRMSQTAGN